jgi:hypothetical protein
MINEFIVLVFVFYSMLSWVIYSDIRELSQTTTVCDIGTIPPCTYVRYWFGDYYYFYPSHFGGPYGVFWLWGELFPIFLTMIGLGMAYQILGNILPDGGV